MRTIRRVTGTFLLTGALLAVSAGAVAAHECMAANRSQQGEQAVGHSPMWLSENMASHEAYEFTFVVVFGVEPTEAMLDEAVAMHKEQGLQEWASFFEGHTLLTNPKTGEDNPAAEKHAGDGQGIDHWSDSELGQAMIAIAADILGL
ncbi:MAG: hypothetical protein WBW88_20435 [Rhodothermales bacterium]